MPVLAAPELTLAAIADVLAQSIPTRLLIINQGVEDAFRLTLERIAEEHSARVLVWSHVPPLPSLAATWNRALRFVWETGEEEALVINNDVRLDRRTCETLSAVRVGTDALFITGVGVTQEQFDARSHDGGKSIVASLVGTELAQVLADKDPQQLTDADVRSLKSALVSNIAKGGPDFSCFLISKAAHDQYPFDEAFVPAFCEDLDTHRRYLLGGDGDQIFSINLPYLHVGGGSNTLKSMTADARARHEGRIGQARAHYARKWGGAVNAERYTIPFVAASAQDGVTTPDLQRAIQQGQEEHEHVSTAFDQLHS